MPTWLVLGCGDVGRDIVAALSSRPGTLRVIVADEQRAENLRTEDVSAVAGDPSDPGTYPESAEMIVVAGDDPTVNRAVTLAAREQFPDAVLIAYTGIEDDEELRQAIATTADETIDPTSALVERALGATLGEDAERLPRLCTAFRSMTGPLAVVCHDNPDPDAIASAIALARLAESFGVEADACYFGDISHQENRALVNVLDIDLRNFSDADDVTSYDAVALVDHSRPGVNDGLPTETPVDIVVDHHPPRGPIEARYVDLRSDVGATSTILADYYRRLGADIDERVATALLYGIRTDTREFTREVSEADFEAAVYLLSHADESVLERVESPDVAPEVFETLGAAIRNRERKGAVLVTCVGRVSDRDAIAQAAQHLLSMEGIEVTLVYGFTDETIHVSGRARNPDVDLGEVLRDAFDRIGNAGGHADMAGAQIPLGIMAELDDDAVDSLSTVVHEVVRDRFFRALSDAPSAPRPDQTLVYERAETENRAEEHGQ